jgi:hypothetical protein
VNALLECASTFLTTMNKKNEARDANMRVFQNLFAWGILPLE